MTLSEQRTSGLKWNVAFSDSDSSWQSALRVRGGVIHITKSNVAAFITGYWLFRGLSSASDPVRHWKNAMDLEVQPRSFAAWAGALIGYVFVVGFKLSNSLGFVLV